MNKIAEMQKMNYKEFQEYVKHLNKKNSIVLIEGKRKLKEEDKISILKLGKQLAEDFPDIIFRTGNAKGADELFAQGVSNISPERLEFILPYKTHKKGNRIDKAKYYSLDEIKISEEIINLTKEISVKNRKIVDLYLSGARNRFTMKAPYLLRDTLKVIGIDPIISKADFGIFYDDPESPLTGGTGYTIRVCQKNNIPVVTQEIWTNWIR